MRKLCVCNRKRNWNCRVQNAKVVRKAKWNFRKIVHNWKEESRGESRRESSWDVRDIWGDYSVGLLVGWLWGHVCVTIRHYICSYIYRVSTIYSLFHCNHNQNISNLTWLGTVSVCFSIVYRLFCFCCKNCKKMQNGSLRKCWRKLAAKSFIINFYLNFCSLLLLFLINQAMPTNNTYQVFDTEMVQQIHTVFV